MRTLQDYLEERKMFKSITLYFDIETFQYNEDQGKAFPSKYKNMTFSVAVGWIERGIVEYEIFNNFKQFFDQVIEIYKPLKKKPTIFLNAHNTNKYDTHFLRRDLIYYYNIYVYNYYLNTGTTEKSNENSLKIKDLKAVDKKGIFLEKRIKSKINLEAIFYLEGIKFETVDNWVKTNASIKMLGKKLKRLNLITDDELKTEFDYLKFNRKEDLTESEARAYSQQIFNQLTKDELIYIRNDVVILAKSAYYYEKIFTGFDYSKRTFTSNILRSYNTNDLTSYQLLNRIGKGKDKYEIRYTDYQFANQNFYDYLKPFYRGGLNFYNQFKLGTIIKSGVFSMDINSSYPYAMHNFKIPTYLNRYQEFEKPTLVKIDYKNDNEYTLYQLDKWTFDFKVLQKIDSVILKQMLVKYYSTTETINLNTYTFKMIQNITGITFDELPVLSTVTFDCEYFGSRKQIEEFYFIKTQGSQKQKIIFKDPYNILLTDEINEQEFTQEEVENSKLNLNGLYGIPALRPYFNLFRLDPDDGHYFNVENGHKNTERNIVFSIFVTSVALWNLLDPMKYLTANEIDEYFLYCDTDSLYFMEEVRHKFPDDLFDPFTLGKWDLEHEHMRNFYVLNHKKYAYEYYDQDDKKWNIEVKAGGVPKDAFNTDMTFEEFIETQFSDGVELYNLKSIYNEQGTISIYPSTTKLEIGKGYRIHTSGKMYNKMLERMKKEVKEHLDEFNDVLYIESVIGTFSLSELFPVTHEVNNKRPLIYLEIYEEEIKNKINEKN